MQAMPFLVWLAQITKSYQDPHQHYNILLTFTYFLFPSLGRDSKEHCESKMDRGMFWNYTLVGEVAKQPCPGGASGLARWKCVGNEQNNNLPTWYPESPDLSDCKSAWLLSLQVSFFPFPEGLSIILNNMT